MTVHHLLLQQFPLLKALGTDACERLAHAADVRAFAKREVVLTKGKPSPFLCFLLEGRLQGVDFTLEGREVGLGFVEPGGYFGELCLVDGLDQPEFVVSAEKSQVLVLPAELVRPIIFQSPMAAEAISRRLAERVRQQLAQRQVLAITNPMQRIAAQIQILAHQNQQNGQITTVHVIKAPTHQELAVMVNLTRETVTRTLQLLQAQGILKREGETLALDHEKLLALTTSATNKKES